MLGLVTFSVGLAVFRMRTAHCTSVVGGSSRGTRGSCSRGSNTSGAVSCADRTGGGSAKSMQG